MTQGILLEDSAGSYRMLPYEPRGACEQLFYCREESVLLEGPAGTGKTRGVLEFVKLLCLTERDIRILFVRKTRESMSETVLASWENDVLPPHMIKGDAQRNNRQNYQMPNGNHIVLGGMDKPVKIMSSDFDLIVFFEATEATPDNAQKLSTRLRHNRMPWQQMIFDCNPGPPSHFLNQLALKGELTRLCSKHTDNPTLYNADGTETENGAKYIARLKRLSGANYQRYFLGNWSAAEGLVYADFDPDIHVITEHDTPFAYYIAGVDWGYKDAGVIQIWGVDMDARLVLVREVYRTLEDIDWWRARAREIDNKYMPKRWICDPAAPDKMSQLSKLQLPVAKAKKDIGMGITVVQSKIANQDDGRPGMYILADACRVRDQRLKECGLATNTVGEFWSYAYKDPKDFKNIDEVPEDFSNHGMDTMRYVFVYVDRFHVSDTVKKIRRSRR